MQGFMRWIGTQDNITFLIAVASFLITTVHVLASLIKSLESYSVDVIDYVKRTGRVVQFLVCVSNLSDMPLTVISIDFSVATCELHPKAIRNNPGAWNFQKTAEFPLCISPHSCQYAYLEFLDGDFQHMQLCRGTAVTFRIRSTRHLGQKSIILGDTSHYLHTKARSPVPRG